jgi:hypothetical protein
VSVPAYGALTTYAATGEERPEDFARARADAYRAIALAPDLNAGHLARGYSLTFRSLEFAQASEEYRRAMAPGDERTLDFYGQSAVLNSALNRSTLQAHCDSSDVFI